jgi:hypothetical protein
MTQIKGKDIRKTRSRDSKGSLDKFDPAVNFRFCKSYEIYEDDKMYEYDHDNETIMTYMVSDSGDNTL